MTAARVAEHYLFQQRGTKIQTREGIQDRNSQLSVLLEQSAAEINIITQPSLQQHSANTTPAYTLELSGYVIVLGILQNLRKTGDNVTLDLHWGYGHQLHKLCGQFLQITGHGKMERSMIHGGYSTQS